MVPESGHDPSSQQQPSLVIIKNHLNEMLILLFLRFDSLNRLSSLKLECDSAVVLKLKVCPVLKLNLETNYLQDRLRKVIVSLIMFCLLDWVTMLHDPRFPYEARWWDNDFSRRWSTIDSWIFLFFYFPLECFKFFRFRIFSSSRIFFITSELNFVFLTIRFLFLLSFTTGDFMWKKKTTIFIAVDGQMRDEW